MEVMQAEETREEKSTPPEWVWDPSIHIIVIPGWRIVAHHGWAFVVIIIVDYRRISVITVIHRRFASGIASRGIGHDRQTNAGGKVLKCLQSFLFTHRQPFGIGRITDGTLQFTDDDGRNWVISNPAIFG
jgi:hypothetical protein